jgi:hypothetical protein
MRVAPALRFDVHVIAGNHVNVGSLCCGETQNSSLVGHRF